jgi:formate hydrogenlyase subunit 6/NADH:ubiquinone oxidoreductase subunit I
MQSACTRRRFIKISLVAGTTILFRPVVASASSYYINDTCINCGACDLACKVNAIYEKKDKREIDPELCIECGVCMDSCPASAIAKHK